MQRFTAMLVAVLFLIMSTGCQLPNIGGSNGGTPTASQAAQSWLLDFGPGPPNCTANRQMARVVVSPFTNSGTFTETSDSPGVYVYNSTCDCHYRLTIGGNVVHDSPYDRWDFVGLAGAGCRMQAAGTGTGTANGNFPTANSVHGQINVTTQNPALPAVSASATFTGSRQ